MTHALVRHIVRQGVCKSEDIAVLTPYSGQLQKLRAKMRHDVEIILSERRPQGRISDGRRWSGDYTWPSPPKEYYERIVANRHRG